MSAESTEAAEFMVTRDEVREVFVDAMVSEVLAEEARLANGQLVSLTPEFEAEVAEAFGGFFDKALPETSESRWIHALLPHVCKCREAFGHLAECHIAAQSAFRSLVRDGLLPSDPYSLPN